jgi:hypothetical protein
VAQRRAALLCDLGDALSLTRPLRWSARARRAYEGAIRRLDGGAAGTATSDPGVVARTLLREARRPYWSLAAIIARVSVLAAAGLFALALLASAASPTARAWLFPPDLGALATWNASSAFAGASLTGKSTRGDGPFFMHTEFQERPWLAIKLPKVAKVREIEIWNRSDCCQERTMPLNVLVPEGEGWRLLCQRRSPFSRWACHPKTRPVTDTIRIEIPQHGGLHLKRVAIYE